MEWTTKMRGISYWTKRNQIKVEKSKFEKVNPENDVIFDGQKVISLRNIIYKSPKNSAIISLR
jgi:hypothetical protein